MEENIEVINQMVEEVSLDKDKEKRSLTDDELKEIFTGKRPKTVDFEAYKGMRYMLNKLAKAKSKGEIFHISRNEFNKGITYKKNK